MEMVHSRDDYLMGIFMTNRGRQIGVAKHSLIKHDSPVLGVRGKNDGVLEFHW